MIDNQLSQKAKKAYLLKLKLNVVFPPALNFPGYAPMPNPIYF